MTVRIYCSVLVVLHTYLGCVQSQRYVVPEASLEFLSPKGLRISIPDDDPEIKLVAYHININEEFQGVQHGHFGADITKKKDGRWSYFIPELRVRQGDVVYYWIHVIVDKLAYNGLDREYRVTNNPHVNSGGTLIPTSFIPDALPSCRPTQTTHDRDTVRVCQGDVLLDTNINNNFNLEGWTHQVMMGGDLPEDEFVVFTKDTSNSFLDDGKFVIKPTLLEEKYNNSFVTSGKYFLEGCTSNVTNECYRQAMGFLILPPVMSARVNTKNKFSFRYGTVEIRAKLPQGKWIVPDELTFTVDNEEVHRIRSVNYSVLRNEVYISLGVHVAGNRDFPDSINKKPWKNSDPKRFLRFWSDKDNWYPSWNDESSLQVEYVKVTAL